jgi:hypothetical protein
MAKKEAPARNFKTTEMLNVPHGRNGKHKTIVDQLLSDLEQLDAGRALKIPLVELPDSKANIRAALNRATRKAGKVVSTAVDKEFLYVWNA